MSKNFQNIFSLKGFIYVAPTPRNGIGVQEIYKVLIPTPLPLFMYDSIYDKDCTKMRLQNLHPYDSFIVGINNIYFVDYQGNFHINAPFIIAPNKTICTGSTYVLIYAHHTKKCIVHQVKLEDAYFDEGSIFLIVRDVLSQESFTIDQMIKCTEDHYKWILMDFDCIVEELNTDIIKSFCGTCTDAKKKSVADSNHKKLNDDMLEFDF